MKTYDIDQLLHAIKPDGHGANPLATELHRLACALQEQTDKVHAALDTVRNPEFKGDVVGELHPWRGHFPLELDHSDDNLNDIMVRGQSVSEHLAAGLWEEAEAYLQEHFGAELSESARRVIARMDAADLRSEQSA
jgi:hypothetical protein